MQFLLPKSQGGGRAPTKLARGATCPCPPHATLLISSLRPELSSLRPQLSRFSSLRPELSRFTSLRLGIRYILLPAGELRF